MLAQCRRRWANNVRHWVTILCLTAYTIDGENAQTQNWSANWADNGKPTCPNYLWEGRHNKANVCGDKHSIWRDLNSRPPLTKGSRTKWAGHSPKWKRIVRIDRHPVRQQPWTPLLAPVPPPLYVTPAPPMTCSHPSDTLQPCLPLFTAHRHRPTVYFYYQNRKLYVYIFIFIDICVPLYLHATQTLTSKFDKFVYLRFESYPQHSISGLWLDMQCCGHLSLVSIPSFRWLDLLSQFLTSNEKHQSV